MKLFGLQIGGKKEVGSKAPQKSDKAGIKQSIWGLERLLMRFKTMTIILLVGGLLAFTAYRMLGYIDPMADEERAAEHAAKLKRVTIDPKVVERIKQLNDSQATAAPNFPSNRENPFSE